MKNQAPPQPPSRKKPSDNNEWMKYSGIGIQILVTTLIGFALGYFLDKLFPFHFPVFKFVCSFGAVILALYVFIKEVSKK
jgi:hypothetical protein